MKNINLKKGNGVVIGIIGLALIVGIVVYMSRDTDSDLVVEHTDTSMIENTESEDSMERDVMMGEESMMQAGSYEVYSPEKLARANDGDVVLFFHATWCPTCRSTDADIQAQIQNIPENLTILKTDYDTYTDLKRMYGVTTQHTFVQVDAEGNLISKWSGSSTLADIVSKVNES